MLKLVINSDKHVKVSNEYVEVNEEGFDEDYVTSEANVDMQHEECEDSDNLYTPSASNDGEEVFKFSTYKSGQRIVFHLRIMFRNKEMVRDAIKE